MPISKEDDKSSWEQYDIILLSHIVLYWIWSLLDSDESLLVTSVSQKKMTRVRGNNMPISILINVPISKEDDKSSWQQYAHLNLDKCSLYLRHQGHEMNLKFMTPGQAKKDQHTLKEKIEKERIEKEEI